MEASPRPDGVVLRVATCQPRGTAWVASGSCRIEVWSTPADPSTPTSSRCRSSISSTRVPASATSLRSSRARWRCATYLQWRSARGLADRSATRCAHAARSAMSKSSSSRATKARERRVALLARVKLAGATLSVACTHLQHSGGDAREQLAAVIETLISRPSPRLLLGDFNLGPDDVEPLLAARGFTAAPSGPTFPAGAPRRRIDWIAVDGGLRVVGARRHDPVVGDHCPLSADSGRGPAVPEPTYRFGVPYATRPMHDADSHIMEPPDWLHPYLDAATRERFPYVWSVGDEPGPAGDRRRSAPVHADPEYRAEDESQIMLRKNFSATGSFLNDDRPQRSTCSASRASSCSTRSRARRSCASIATAITSSRSRSRARSTARSSTGVRSTRACCPSRSCPSATWTPRSTLAREVDRRAAPRRSRSASTARPITRRVTSRSNRCGRCARKRVCRCCCTSPARARNVMPPAFFENGRPPVPDFHGGDTNFKSIDYLSIPLPVMQTLNALVIDGVLQRHPDAAHRRHRARRVVGAGLDAHARLRARGVPQERGAAAADGDEAERVRAAPGARHAVPARGHGLDDRQLGADGVPVLVGLPARRGRPQSRSRGSSAAWTRPASTPATANASTSTTSSTCWVRCSIGGEWSPPPEAPAQGWSIVQIWRWSVAARCAASSRAKRIRSVLFQPHRQSHSRPRSVALSDTHHAGGGRHATTILH